MSNNKDLIAELDRFKDLKGDPFYALQIDAPWGSGKTHFITNYLESRFPEKPGEDRPYLHITLFGARSIDEIDRQVTGQLFGSGGRETGAIVASALAAGAAWLKADKLVTEVAGKIGAKAVKTALDRIKNGMIIFDDVERCSMPLKDALGYINQFVERNKFKVILISNEKALTRPDASAQEKENAIALASFKEKLIGRTLRYVSDPEQAYDVFVKDFHSDLAKRIAQEKRAEALKVFRASKRDNLRSLRIGLETFDRITSSIPRDTSIKDDGLRDVLLECIYVALEAGAAVKQSLISHVKTMRVARLLRGMGGQKSEAPSEDDKTSDSLVARYSDVINLENPTIPFELIVDLVANGILRSEEIAQALRISPSMNEASAVPLWRRLIEVWDYTTIQIASDSAEVSKRFEEFSVTDPGELMHLAGIMKWWESQGVLTLSGGVSPKDFIAKYLADMSKAGKHLDANFKAFASDRLSAYGYVVAGADEFKKELLEIHKLIRGAMNEAASTKFPEIYGAICQNFKKQDRDLDHMVDKEFAHYLRMPIFANRDPAEVSDIVMRDNGYDWQILKWFSERYEHYVPPEVKAAEQEWLDGLYSELKDRISKLQPPLNKWWLTILNNNLEKHLSATAANPSSEPIS